MKTFDFKDLQESNLIIDAVYQGGQIGNAADDPINKILQVGNQGGFRYAGGIDHLKYIVLYTSGENLDWPDSINPETGIFKYYGDNRKPGHELHDTSKKGNLILKNLFDSLYSTDHPRKKFHPYSYLKNIQRNEVVVRFSLRAYVCLGRYKKIPSVFNFILCV
jgi:hypothetical protein